MSRAVTEIGRGALTLLVAIVLAVSGAAVAELRAAPPGTPADLQATASDGVPAPDAAAPQVPVAPPSAGAWYCPVVAEEDERAVLSVGAVGAAPATVTVTRHLGGDETVEESLDLAPGAVVELERTDAAAAHPSTVRWSGSPVVAAWRVESTDGTDGTDGNDVAGARCETAPEPIVHLTGLDTRAPSTSTLHLFNAFDRDAVVRVTFGTPTGPVSLALTDNIAVPAGETTIVVLDEFEPEQPDLAVTVETLTGRVVTQGVVALGSAPSRPGPTGRAVVRGTGEPVPGGAFASAVEGDAATSWLSLYNPGDRDAAVQVRVSDPLASGESSLEEVRVPAGAVSRVALADASSADELGVQVESLNEVAVVATRLIGSTEEEAEGAAASSAEEPTSRWAIVAGGEGATRIALYNPTTEAVTISVDAGKATPAAWSELILRPNERTTVDLADLGDGEAPLVLLVEADGPIVTDLRSGAWTAGGVPSPAWEGPGTRPAVHRDERLSTRPTSGTPIDE